MCNIFFISDELDSIHVSPEVSSSSGLSVMERYKFFLQSRYDRNSIASDDKLDIAPCSEFINLVVVKKQDQQDIEFIDRRLTNSPWINNVSKKIIKLDKVVDVGDKFVLVEGSPGMGKSTLSLQLCRKWDCYQSLREFKMVLLLRLRETRVQNLTSLCDMFYHEDKQLPKQLVEVILKNEGKGVLLVLDGFDELPAAIISEVEESDPFIIRLLRGEILPCAVRLVTSRPSVIYKKSIFPITFKHIVIEGFTDECKLQFAKKAFQLKPESLFKQFKNFVTSNPIISSLMYVPVNCAIIVQVYEDITRGGKVPKTMTELFYLLTIALIRRHQIGKKEGRDKYCVSSLSALPKALAEPFAELCELAYRGLFKDKTEIVFLQEKVHDHLGLMIETKEMYVSEGTKTTYTFHHLSMQSFLAAWFATQITEYSLLDSLKVKQDESFLLFYCGLKMEFSAHELGAIADTVLSTSILQCVYESQNFNLVKLFDSEIVIDSPIEMYIIGFFLKHSGHTWNVSIGSSITPLIDSVNQHEEFNGTIQSLSFFQCPIGEMLLLPTSLLHGISSLGLIEAKITYAGIKAIQQMKNLRKLTLIFFGICNKGVHEMLSSLAQVQELHVSTHELSFCCVLMLSNFLRKYSLKHITIEVDQVHQQIPYLSIIEALFTSPSLTSVGINFGFEIAARYFSTTNIKRIDFLSSKICELIPIINYGIKVNSTLKFEIHSNIWDNTTVVTSSIPLLAIAYRKTPFLMSEATLTRSFTSTSDNMTNEVSSFKEGEYRLTPDLRISDPIRFSRRRSCPELLYLQTVCQIHHDLHERLSIIKSEDNTYRLWVSKIVNWMFYKKYFGIYST